jgi:putative addiction module killer protein
MELVEYQTNDGKSPFAEWYDSLDAIAAAKVTVAIIRMGQGNFSNAKGVGAGVQEFRIHYGPGYRVYFGKDGAQLIILLAGGTKKRQQKDIEAAKARWQDYKQRKRKG